MSLWMLYHLGYHDVPTTGVGIYGDSLETGEKVVILQKCGGIVLCCAIDKKY